MPVESIFSGEFCPVRDAPKSTNLKCLLLKYITSPNFPEHPFPSDFAEFKLNNAKDKHFKGMWQSTEALTSIDTINIGLHFPPTPGITNDKTMEVRVFTSTYATGERMVQFKLDIRNNGEVIKYKDVRDDSVIKLQVRIGVEWSVNPRFPKSSAAMSEADIKRLVRDLVEGAFNKSAELKEKHPPGTTSGLGPLTVRVEPKDST